MIAGGSPTFGLWAKESGWDCSPGTSLFWDQGYSDSFPELPFEIAAVLLTRVISKPGKNYVCLDLGHKSVAGENPIENRVRLLNFPDEAKPVGQSEEHLVMEFPEGSSAIDVAALNALTRLGSPGLPHAPLQTRL